MFNYSEGYSNTDFRPSAGLLRPTQYMPLQAGATYDGDDLKVLDPLSITDGTKWGRTEPENIETYNKYYALVNYMTSVEGGMTGVSSYIKFAQEPLKGFIIRQVMKQHPTKPWLYGDDELTDDVLEKDSKVLERLLEWRKQQPESAVAAGQTKDADQQISGLMTKLLYAEAKKQAKDTLGFSWLDLLDASNVFWGYAPLDLAFGDSSLASTTEDIEKRLSAYDPNFDPRTWFAQKFPSESNAFYGVIQNGVSVDTILDSPNADHAMYRIMTILNTNDIQRRMATYKPSILDQLRLFRDTFVGGMINSPGELVLGTTAEIGLIAAHSLLGSLLGSAVPGVGTVTGAAVGTAAGVAATTTLSTAGLFMRLRKVYNAASVAGKALRGAGYAAETLYKLPLGVMPSYVANYGLIRSTAATFGFGVVQGTLAEASRQQREIAFGIATLNANPYAQADYDLSTIVTAGLETGLMFGASFGLGGNLLRTGVGSLRNKLQGVVVDPKLGVRDRADRRFSLEGTPLGKTIDNFRGKFSKPIIDAPVPEKLAKESLINNEGVTPEKLAAETKARVERAESREVLDSPTAAKGTPEDTGTRRYINETIGDYLKRVAPARAVVNIVEFLSSVAQRTRRGADGGLIDESQQFSTMGYGDQLRVALGADEHLAEARRIETEAVGLTPERERVYGELSASRRALIKELKKKLTDLEYRSIIDEWKNKTQRSTQNLPDLIAKVRDQAAPLKERQKALQEVALNVLEKARNIANNPDSAEELRNSVPPELRDLVDVAVIEQKLNNGRISVDTVKAIEAASARRKPKPAAKPNKKETKLHKLIREAGALARVDPERLAKIKKLIDNPANFVDIVTGNRENAQRFFEFVQEAVDKGMMTKEHSLILLAATVHLNFDSSVLNVRWAFDFVDDTAGGFYENNTITINTKFYNPANVATHSRKMINTVLHELGHAYFAANASGGLYMLALKGFNRLHFSEKTSFIRRMTTTGDSLLDNTENLQSFYMLQNVEEFTVEAWSNLMFRESEAVINSLSPVNVTAAQKLISNVMTNLIVVADMFNSSEIYHSTKQLMDGLIDLDGKLDQAVSVKNLRLTYEEAHASLIASLVNVLPEESAAQPSLLAAFNNNVVNRLSQNANKDLSSLSLERYKLTQEELNFFLGLKTNESRVAFTIAKSFGKELFNKDGATNQFKVFLDALKLYKKTTVASYKFKLAYFLSNPEDVGLFMALSKKEKLKLLGDVVFGTNADSRFLISDETRISPTYEENLGLGHLESARSESSIASLLEDLVVTDRSEMPFETFVNLLTNLETDRWFTNTTFQLVGQELRRLDLPEIAEFLQDYNHRTTIENMMRRGIVYSVEDSAPTVTWSTKEGALSTLSMMLELNLTRNQIEAMLNNNVDPNLITALMRQFNQNSQLLNAVNDLITTGKIEYDSKINQWTLAKAPKKTKAPKAPAEPKNKNLAVVTKPDPEVVAAAKNPEVVKAAEKAALETDSMAVTADNLKDMLTLMVNSKLGNINVVGQIFLKPEATLRNIAEGKIKTLTDLIKYTKGFIAEKAKKERERKPLARDKAKFTQKEQRATVFSMFLDYHRELDNRLFTPEEVDLLEKLNQFETNAELGKALGVSDSTAGNRRRAMETKIQTIVKQANINAGDGAAAIVESLQMYLDDLKETARTTKPSRALEQQVKADNKAPETPPKIPEATAEKAAATMVADVTNKQKLQNTNPEPVPTITETTPTKGVLYRATSEATQNVPEGVLRSEKQVDALVAQSTEATKETVEFTPKKPLKVDRNHADLSPEAIDKLKAGLSGFGNDALVFKDGVVIPLDEKAVRVIGQTKITAEPDKGTQATLTVEGKVPTVKIEPAKSTTEKAEDAPFVTRKLPAPQPAESRVYPKDPIPTDAVPTTAAEKLERQTNSDPLLLRKNGMDTNFLRLFAKRFLGAKLEPEALTLLTDKFKYLWSRFVLVNHYIAEANRLALGDNVMERFWAAVDRISLEQDTLVKVTEGPSGKKPLTYKQVLQKAAEEVSTPDKSFVLPLLPEDVRFVKADAEGNHRLSAKSKEHKAIIEASGEDITVGPPKVEEPEGGKPKVELPGEEGAAKAGKPVPDLDKSLAAAIDNDNEGASLLLRENNLISRFFGGNQRALRTWWEKLMNASTAATQGTSEMANTIRSGFSAIRFIARLFDDTRTQLAHLVGAGKEARATAMQMKSEESRLIVSVLREWAKLTAMLPRMAPVTRRALEMTMYEALYTNGTVTKDMFVKIGIPEYKAEQLANQANMILKKARYANQAILRLEAETGRLISVDSEGKPIDPNYFAPTQIDHEQIKNMKMPQFEELIKDLVSARTKRKLNSPILDRNTMVVMGWLDVRKDPDSDTYVLFAPNRIFKASEAVNMFTAETLQKLKIGSIASSGMEGDAAKIFKLMNIADPENYFVMRTDTGFDVYRVPKKISDLNPADAARYTEAVKGNVAMYTEAWRQRLGGKNLIEHEMRELMKQKTRQYPYNKTNTPDSIFKQPVFRLLGTGEQEDMALPIKGLTPEEFMETELTKSVLRTNMAEAYYYFLHGRYFELAFQKQLNTMLGRKDKTIEDVLLVAQAHAERALDAMAEKENWTAGEKTVASKSIGEGIQRLREEYQYNADILPYLQSTAGGWSRVALAAMRYKLSPGFAVSALVETMTEIIKQSPNVLTIPKNLVNVLRFVLLDKRFSKNKLLQSEIGDTIFILENFRTDLSNRFMGEIGQGAFRSDGQLGTRFADAVGNIRNGETFGERVVRTTEEAGRVMQSIGSLQAITMATRELAKVRIQKLVWKYAKSGKLGKMFSLLTEPETAARLAKLEQEAVTNRHAAAKLFKEFAGIARKAGITDADEAALFLKYGLTTQEQIRHLVWAIDKIGDKEGRVDMITLSELRNDLLDNPVEGIDPNTLSSAVSAYAHMVEDMITKTAVSELKGLNKITKIDSRTPLGRLWYALTSWTRSFQDNVIMDFGSRSAGKYVASGIFLYAAVEAVNGLLKEWLAGREVEDILEEMEDHPAQFVVRGLSRMPVFGVYNGILEASAAGITAASGGTLEYYGVPGMTGFTASVGATLDIGRNLKNIGSAAKEGEVDIKSASKLFGADAIINKSLFAIPARTLETAGAFRDMEAVERYLKTVHRDPYPYMKKKTSESIVSTKPLDLPKRNYLLEEERAKEARKKDIEQKSMIRQSVDSQQGVSGLLGDLLKGT